MVTIREIAQLAEVSIATVSNVLNGSRKVKEKTREKVLKIAKELDYKPNIMAKSLKGKNSQTIGVITEDITVFNTPEIVNGIEQCAESHGNNIILCNLRLAKKYGDFIYDDQKFFLSNADYQTSLSNAINVLSAKQADGIIYIGSYSRPIEHIAAAYKKPIIYSYCFCPNSNVISVTYDDKNASYDIANCIFEQDHRQVGIIAGPRGSVPTQNRLAGIQRAMFEHGILYNPSLTIYSDWSKNSGYHAAAVLIDNGVTAIIAMNDHMAGGVIDFAREHGIAIPEKLSVVGFDNREFSDSYTPKLTTVALPLNEIGMTAASELFKLIDKESDYPEASNIIRLPCSVVKRCSVGRAPGNKAEG